MKINKLTGIITSLFGLIFTFATLNLPRAALGNPMAPLYFPLICGVGITVCGVAYYIVKGKKGNSVSAGSEGEKFSLQKISKDDKLIALTCVLGLLYAVLFHRIGYILSTVLFLGGMLFALNDGLKKWKTNILVAVGFSVIIYILFYRMLGIPLPQMPVLNI